MRSNRGGGAGAPPRATRTRALAGATVTFVAALAAATGCADLQKSMNELNKPQPQYATSPASGPADASGTTASSASVPAPTAPPPASVAHAPATAPATPGTCAASCNHYLTCKGIMDPAAGPFCLTQCEKLNKTRDELTQYEAMPCPQAVAVVDGTPVKPAAPAATNAGAPGARPGACPPPTGPQRSPEEEKIFQATTNATFCGWTYNKNTGMSRESRVKFFPDGSMVHQFRTERSGNTTDGWGNVTGSFASSNASGDKYCWKLAYGYLLYSSDGASYANFVNKVENNGYGVIFFHTRLGELKACQ